jgi:hypothetical protein
MSIKLPVGVWSLVCPYCDSEFGVVSGFEVERIIGSHDCPQRPDGAA